MDRSIQPNQQQNRSQWARRRGPTIEQKQYGERQELMKMMRQIKGRPQVTFKGLNTPPAMAFCCTECKTVWLLQEIPTVLQKVTHCVTVQQQRYFWRHPNELVQVPGTRPGSSLQEQHVLFSKSPEPSSQPHTQRG